MCIWSEYSGAQWNKKIMDVFQYNHKCFNYFNHQNKIKNNICLQRNENKVYVRMLKECILSSIIENNVCFQI